MIENGVTLGLAVAWGHTSELFRERRGSVTHASLPATSAIDLVLDLAITVPQNDRGSTRLGEQSKKETAHNVSSSSIKGVGIFLIPI